MSIIYTTVTDLLYYSDETKYRQKNRMYTVEEEPNMEQAFLLMEMLTLTFKRIS